MPSYLYRAVPCRASFRSRVAVRYATDSTSRLTGFLIGCGSGASTARYVTIPPDPFRVGGFVASNLAGRPPKPESADLGPDAATIGDRTLKANAPARR